MQSYTAVGRLVKSPNLSYSNDVPKCEFVLAVETRKGSFKRTDFIPCVLWRGLAESFANYVVKGQRIGIKGEWRSNNYQDGDRKETRYEVEVYETYFYEVPN